ncbi:MAG: hypothetical protein HOV80_06695 [Polyangiaceae bacterium]|nr:hypothetical protein [Polyangiaceae bacterium]
MNRLPAALLLLVACGAPDAPEPEEKVCVAGVARSALDAVDRKITGAAAPYPADGTLRATDAELKASQAERRRVAWATVEKVLTNVPLAETPPSLDHVPATIPTWQTWYGFDDLRRVFHHLYEDLSPDERASRTPFSDQQLDDAFLWNVGSVHELPNWPKERYLEYLAAIDSATDVAGLGGLSRVGYSPAAARHLIASYPKVLACRDKGVPPAIADGPVEEVEIDRQAVEAASCQTQAVGSYAIGPGETLRARIEEGVGSKLDLVSADATCTSEAGEWCEIAGPAIVEVSATAGIDALHSVVTVHRAAARPEWADCLDGPFPIDGAIVKADYRRADLEIKLPTFVTSADAMKARLTGDVSWTVADGEADPGPADIYTLTLPTGPKYRLAALHIMTKELDHWLWITLWWSETPNEDFGADRPKSIAGLGGPWQSYKMCVTTAFNEEDPLPGGGFDTTYPSLASALSAVYAGQGAPTWCSNPYLEEGHGNAATNCIGCHQHGGTELRPEDILLLSDFGRPARRNNFPADYSWATTRGDDLGQLFADEELWWKAAQ